VAPNGTLVWSWNTRDHIPLSETGERWWSAMPINTLPDGRKAYDYAHINSIEKTGNTIVASLRHFDAAYAINRTTGDVIWKLGGTHRPESLTVVDDPHGSFPLGGQHFARVLPDGTLTLHDNATFLDRVPRSVRYRIDMFDKTARLLEQLEDPAAPTSFCCGSSQRFSDGSWLMSWGGTPVITEFGPAGGRRFTFTIPGAISYRVAPLPSDGPAIANLRAGMDAMAPR
jgi:Arylsulfotransferase (ASST)